MKALITGGSGFIGRHFIQRLERDGYDVRAIDIAPPQYWNAVDFFAPKLIQTKYDLVVHAAAYGPNRAAIDSTPNLIVRNTELDAAMFRWAIETQQPNVIYFSSSAVYSNDLRHPTLGGDVTAMKFSFEESRGHSLEPFDDYGLTKRHGEHMAMAAQRCGVNVSILRPFSGYGTDQSTDFPFGAFINRAIRGEDPFTIWGDAEQARDFIHVDDIVEAALTINLAQVREPVNVCTGVATTMLRLAETVIRARDVFSRYSPKIQVDETAPMGVTYRVGDPTSLHRWYTPRVTIEQGVHRAIEELHRG